MTNSASGIDVSAREHVALPHRGTRLGAALCGHSTAGELRHVASLGPFERYTSTSLEPTIEHVTLLEMAGLYSRRKA